MNIDQLLLIAPTGGALVPWQLEHNRAIDRAIASGVGHAAAIVLGIGAWLEYRDAHRARYYAGIGADRVLGDPWLQWGASLRALLNGETGGLDYGTLDSVIVQTLEAEHA